MSGIKGIGGREVPGAEPVYAVDHVGGDQGSGHKKKKKRTGRKGKKAKNGDTENGTETGAVAQAPNNAPKEQRKMDDLEAIIEGQSEDWSSTSVGEDADITVPHDPEALARAEIEEWLKKETSDAYVNNMTAAHLGRVIDHIYYHQNPQANPEWNQQMRLIVWRAVIRANFFWVNSDTGLPTGKPKPIHHPDGVHSGNLELHIWCAAERADRVGRDLPHPEYVKVVEDQVKAFLPQAEKRALAALKHLTFMLVFDEEQKRVIDIEDLQERIGRAFTGADINWEGLTMVKKGPKIPPTNPNIETADRIWRAVMAVL